jgi:DNA helicase-2/ATP-dependent DNA helicase PcrA
VLFRTNHDSALLELELTGRQIPFVKYGGLRYLDAAHVKDFVALLRLVDNLSDELSWFRVLQLPEGMGPARARRVLDAMRDGSAPVADLERWSSARGHVPEASRTHADALIAALAGARDRGGDIALGVERLRAAIAPLVRLRYPDGAVRCEDLDQLTAAAAQATKLASFVAELVLDPPSSTADWAGPPHLDEDYLVLSTVHSAKGLEWDAVYVIAAYDGNFPADMSTANAETIAEERRLFYVALTRARRRLHVYVPVRYYHQPRARDDAHGYGRASRFLDPAVQELFDVARLDEQTPAGGREEQSRRVQVDIEGLLR